MAIPFTKSFSASNDGEILFGVDLGNLQSDIDTYTMHLADTQTVTGNKNFSGSVSFTGSLSAITLLSSTASVDMKTAASTTLYTVPTGKVCRLVAIVIRDTSASLAGGTSYSFTNFRQTVDLSSLTTLATDYIVLDGNNVKYTETAAGVAIQITVTTGSTVACTATIDVFGYLI